MTLWLCCFDVSGIVLIGRSKEVNFERFESYDCFIGGT